MDLLDSEISQTLGLRLVDQVYLNEEGDRVVIELKVNSSLGLVRENILFFSASAFKAEQVIKAILHIRRELNTEEK